MGENSKKEEKLAFGISEVVRITDAHALKGVKIPIGMVTDVSYLRDGSCEYRVSLLGGQARWVKKDGMEHGSIQWVPRTDEQVFIEGQVIHVMSPMNEWIEFIVIPEIGLPEDKFDCLVKGCRGAYDAYWDSDLYESWTVADAMKDWLKKNGYPKVDIYFKEDEEEED